MLGAWRYIILISTIIGAVLTPSTDPLTQLLLSFAILLLYFSGVGILFLIKN
jgi:sec-independent protein translocase protein TatC